MSKIITVAVYEFDELSDKAKEAAIEYVKAEYGGVDSDYIKEVFEERLKEYGYPTSDIEFRLSYSQGDGVAFYGVFNPVKVLQRLGFDNEAENLSGSTWVIRRNQFGNYYSHYNTMTLSIEDEEDSQFVKIEEAVRQDIVNVSKELEKLGYSMIEDSDSDDSIVEYINANEYLFLENGKIWRV